MGAHEEGPGTVIGQHRHFCGYLSTANEGEDVTELRMPTAALS